MVKIDVGAVGQLLAQGRYIFAMPTFVLAGVVYDYLKPDLEGDPGQVRSWEYGKYPQVEAAVPLVAGGTVKVYGEASHWGNGHIIVSWFDDPWHPHWAWIPAGNVRRLTDSEWDIIEYHRCQRGQRPIRLGNDCPGSCLNSDI